MLRWQTAGESHGEALVAMIEGMPAGVRVTSQDIVGALARRRLGYGRGARMKFEQDQVRLLTGVRHGETLGSPIAIEIGNTEWPKWTQVMSADPLDHDLPREGRNAPLSRPRPGHADLTGMRKYGFDDARPVLERSSARETASRVALGAVAALFLEQSLGIRTVAHVISIGGAGVEDPASAPLPAPDDVAALDASPVRTLDKDAEARMIARIDEAKANADTLGGVVEVIAYGVADARTVSLFYFLLAFSHCCAGILRGTGRPIIPMAIMLATWCALRIAYITAVTHFIPDIRVIYWAYPLTWFLGGLLFAVCLLRLRFPSDAALETYK